MLDNVESRKEQVVDARGAGRFLGSEPEPRPGVRAGHMPHSINVPFTQASCCKHITMASAATLLPHMLSGAVRPARRTR